MKHFNLILAGIIVVSLIACGKNSPKGGVSSLGGTSNPGGTIDGGGGNSLNGKMLESYIINPEELPAYKALEPLLLALEKSLVWKNLDDSGESGNYFSPIAYILKFKPWYVIPERITAISNDKIGVPFVNGTEQVALQTFDAIWIDKNALERMPLEEQAVLILHEVFMGLKILKIDSTEKYLSAFYFQNPDLENSLSGYGKEDLKLDARGEFNITPQDVDRVRAVTSKVWSLRALAKNKDFEKHFNDGDYSRLLVQHQFEKLLVFKNHSKINDKETQSVGLYEINSGMRVSIDKIISNISNYPSVLWTNYRYQTGKNIKENGPHDVAMSSCQIRMKKLNNDEVEVKFNIKGTSKINGKDIEDGLSRSSTYKFKVPENLRYRMDGFTWYDDKKLPAIYLTGEGPTKETAHTIEILFDGQDVAQIRYVIKVVKPFEFGPSGDLVSIGSEVSDDEKFDHAILCANQMEFKVNQ